MRPGRLVFLIALPLMVSACAQLNPRPGPIRAMAPRPNPPLSRVVAPQHQMPENVSELQHRLRQNRWLARFWAELTPAQRARVATRMGNAAPGATTDRADAARRWDVMGLEDRSRLVFGHGSAQPTSPSVATDTSSESTGGG